MNYVMCNYDGPFALLAIRKRRHWRRSARHEMDTGNLNDCAVRRHLTAAVHTELTVDEDSDALCTAWSCTERPSDDNDCALT